MKAKAKTKTQPTQLSLPHNHPLLEIHDKVYAEVVKFIENAKDGIGPKHYNVKAAYALAVATQLHLATAWNNCHTVEAADAAVAAFQAGRAWGKLTSEHNNFKTLLLGLKKKRNNDTLNTNRERVFGDAADKKRQAQKLFKQLSPKWNGKATILYDEIGTRINPPASRRQVQRYLKPPTK